MYPVFPLADGYENVAIEQVLFWYLSATIKLSVGSLKYR